MNDLCDLLSDDWLNDNHIDFFASFFNDIASNATLPILIAQLPFSRALQPFEELGRRLVREEVDKAVLERPFIKKILDGAEEGKKLYMPHYLDNHWVVVCIDKDEKVVSYGEYKQYSV